MLYHTSSLVGKERERVRDFDEKCVFLVKTVRNIERFKCKICYVIFCFASRLDRVRWDIHLSLYRNNFLKHQLRDRWVKVAQKVV